ncbi:dTDP-4-dehydrorhamnose reductase [uncultured Thermanaerothrix sp.]|uniref:dTDP-4-dehydrorhamnose reductase n=1 Tax=uncultured Thermanaerothrix sp. TaxID=1195149 RepID=UPI00260BE5D8|nr:dTDP-4-dehydrorhamnose reductase [uncultured Thermanaerothrix sp.]
MRILLLGHLGQLGWEARRSLACLGEIIALDYPQIDLSQPQTLPPLIREIRPHIIYNATAYTAVDKAEQERHLAEQINAVAPGVLAECAREIRAVLIHFSTDYVFDGNKGTPYTETDPPNPLNVYGKTKWQGEQAVQAVDDVYLIFRTSWVYSLRRDSFVTKVLEWSRKQEVLRVVDDQIGNPTWARMLAEVTANLLSCHRDDPYTQLHEKRGLYHLAGKGWASRFEWAQAILALDSEHEQQATRQLLPARTKEFPTPARRPLFSALDCTRFEQTFNLSLPPWREALALAMQR